MQATAKRILYTRHDGGVSVHCPAPGAFYWMQRGGCWGAKPRGFFDEQVRRMMHDGISEGHARRYLDALQHGGVTEAEAWGILRDRDCDRFGHTFELIDFADLPDRWFRNAWVRGHNGGPPHVSLEKARPVQWLRIKHAQKVENQKRDIDLYSPGPLELPEGDIKARIFAARDELELRYIWPEELAA